VYNCIREEPDGQAIAMFREDYDEREFKFDKVLGVTSDQEETFDAVGADVVDDVLQVPRPSTMAGTLPAAPAKRGLNLWLSPS